LQFCSVQFAVCANLTLDVLFVVAVVAVAAAFVVIAVVVVDRSHLGYRIAVVITRPPTRPLNRLVSMPMNEYVFLCEFVCV